MGKSSVQIDGRLTCGARGVPKAATAHLHPAGRCIRLPAGRRATRVASSLSIVRSAASSRERRSSIRGCSGWGCVEGLKNLFVLFVEREFILLEFSVCSCGVSLVSLS